VELCAIPQRRAISASVLPVAQPATTSRARIPRSTALTDCARSFVRRGATMEANEVDVRVGVNAIQRSSQVEEPSPLHTLGIIEPGQNMEDHDLPAFFGVPAHDGPGQ
jgi:hypothetical protein